MKEKARSLIVIILLIGLTSVAQNIPGERKPIPGAEKVYLSELRASGSGIQRVESLLNLSAYYLFLPREEKEDLDQSISYARKAIELSAALNYPDGINEGHLIIAYVYYESGNVVSGKATLDSALVQIVKVKEESKSLHQPEREIRALRQLATLHQLQENYTRAEAELLEMIKIFQAHGFPNMHYTYHRLAFLNNLQGNSEKSLLYSLEGIRIMKTTGDYASSGFFYASLGFVYRDIGQYQKCIDYYEEAFLFFKKYRSSYLYELKCHITEAMSKMGKSEEAIVMLNEMLKEYPPNNNFEIRLIETYLGNNYRVLKQYALAEPHYQKMFELQKLENSLNPQVYKNMGQFYAEWGKFDQARPYLETAFQLMKPTSHLHYLMYMVDSAQGNYPSAIRHLMQTKILDDVQYTETKTKAIQELQVKYETEIKDRDLAFLKQENLLQQAKVQEAATTRNMFIGGAVMLMLLLILGYSRYRLKQRVNQEMSKKNLTLQHLVDEKEWLLKEVHHRVKNNLQTVLSLLESQSRYLSNDALHAIQNSQNRVYAMSLIHKKLYLSSDVASINMEDYLKELIRHLRDSFGPEQEVKFNLDFEPIELDVSQAVPIGLIVNEAITNSIKYAFPEKQQDNQISISIEQSVNKEIELVISDNGIGLAKADHARENSGNLGLKLIKGLTEDIEGNFSMKSESGFKIWIRFVPNIPLKKINGANLSGLIVQEV